MAILAAYPEEDAVDRPPHYLRPDTRKKGGALPHRWSGLQNVRDFGGSGPWVLGLAPITIRPAEGASLSQSALTRESPTPPFRGAPEN